MSKIEFEPKEYRAYAELAKKAGFKNVDELMNAAVESFIRNHLIETEEVTVQVPSKLLKLVKDHEGEKWLSYLSDLLTDSIAADIIAGVFGNHEQVIKEFGLTEEWQFYQGH